MKGELTPTPPASEPVANRYLVEEAKPVKKEVDAGGHIGTVQEGGGTGRRFRPRVLSLWQSKREGVVKKTALGFRVFGFVFSLVSLSVMASDKNQGWTLDSFDRYKEFRHYFSVIIAFVYSAAQVLNLSIQLATGRSNLLSQYGYFQDFALDQLAKVYFGASKVAVTCSPAKAELLKGLGADVTVATRMTTLKSWERNLMLSMTLLVRECAKGVKAVPRSCRAFSLSKVRRWEDYINHRRAGSSTVRFMVTSKGFVLKELNPYFEEGKLKPVLDPKSPFKFCEALEAFALLNSRRSTGKVVIAPIS
ncbi:hypothetical protein OROHE_004838 [Orobanche hederae]